MNKSLIKKLLISVVPVIIVASLGSLFVFLGMDWFNSLVKPSQWIPNWIIPVVWSVIYTITGIILFNWADKGYIPKSTMALFITNGVLNILWCLLFFTLHLTLVGLVAIIINLIFAYLFLFNIRKFKSVYFYWLFIYPIWLSIATSLNLALWILN